MTKVGDHQLRVDMEDWDVNARYALYNTFNVGDTLSKYKLSIGGYSSITTIASNYTILTSITTIASNYTILTSIITIASNYTIITSITTIASNYTIS
jgi:hypothetical protein